MGVIPEPKLDEAAMPWAKEITRLLREAPRTAALLQSTAFVADAKAEGAKLLGTEAVVAASTAREDAEVALTQVMGSITSSLDEYVVSSSSTVAPDPLTGGWSADTPDWTSGQYVWRRTMNTRLDGTVFYSAPAVITGTDGAVGEDAVLLRVSSTRGTSFKNSAISTVLTVTVFKGAQRITTYTDLQTTFGVGSYLEWWWRRINDIDFGVVSSADNRLSESGFSLTISPADVDEQSVFECRLQTPN